MRITTTGTTLTISNGNIHVITQSVDGGNDADLREAFKALGVELAQTGHEVGVAADQWNYDEDGYHRVWWLDLSEKGGEKPW